MNTELPFFNFRVLIESDSTYKMIVARCLETGSVATADDPDTAMDMIHELLCDEARYAIEHGNLSNLFSTPAPIEVWDRWRETGLRTPPKPLCHALRTRHLEFPTEITVAVAPL